MTSKTTVCLKFKFSYQRGYLCSFIGTFAVNLHVRQYFVLFISIIYVAGICVSKAISVSNACYHSVQNLSSSSLLSKNLKIKIYRNIILPVVLYGCETWSLTLREERRLRVFENWVLRRIFGLIRDEVTAE